MGGVNAQPFGSPCDNPNTRDIRDVYLGIAGNASGLPFIIIDLCDQTVTLNTVLYKFPTFTLPTGHTVRLRFGDANNTVSGNITSGETLPFTYPINTGSSPINFSVKLEMRFNNNIIAVSSPKTLTLNPSSVESGGIFTPPTTVPITGPGSVPPPVLGAFPNNPDGSLNTYNGNTTGGADV